MYIFFIALFQFQMNSWADVDDAQETREMLTDFLGEPRPLPEDGWPTLREVIQAGYFLKPSNLPQSAK